jgi:hypothetical protein
MTQFLYLIRCSNEEVYKIGIAGDVRSRIANLQTGNPYKLELADCYSFSSADAVERVLHMKFEGVRMEGEWFRLSGAQLHDFGVICNMLDGKHVDVDNHVTPDEIEEAEEIQEAITTDNGEWDYAAMFANGWRIEARSQGKYWQWRERRRHGKTIYGGRVADFPCPLDELRRLYDVERVETGN